MSDSDRDALLLMLESFEIGVIASSKRGGILSPELNGIMRQISASTETLREIVLAI